MPVLGKRGRKRPIAAACVALTVAAVLFWAGCASTPPAPTANAEGIKTVLVLPFVDMAELYGPDEGVRSPISGQAFETGPVEEGACLYMTQQMFTFLEEKTGFTPIPFEDAEGVLEEVMNAHNSIILSRQMVCEVGQRMGVDGVAAGHVYRFRNRVGKAFSVDTPASVAFDVHLLQVSQQKILWSGRYDETQKALSDNLFDFSKFIKRGGAWVTAEKLAAGGLDKALETFPKQ
ncbi:conserved hypothetical protein [Desulfatibacillum aliphaticivorans]|uniref:Lipoprotein n=1 Tax=Desulfatibacillum aliphaticivorans TaxID=218208 RepID=B8FBL6_DESAL|nr:hypothetical protein [Desulfatibacillum aliphaticivorans]ACL04769.1 conserved hypothetical protein [Desulfatibacillum aliphaticivorans]